LNPIRVFAPAKINLSLCVLGRRNDGYHALESLVGFASFGDTVIINPTQPSQFRVSGPFASALAGEGDNLVLRAQRGLEQLCGQPLPGQIELIKNIPVASGVGGGSTDAAATLRGLAQCYDVPDHAVRSVAQACGADVPACLDGGGKWMTGIGHDLTPVALPQNIGLVLVRPPHAVSTASVFSALQAPLLDQQVQPNSPPDIADRADLLKFVADARNDLEAPAIQIVPEIEHALARLRAIGGVARMSGSGATCFALFAAEDMPHDLTDRLDFPRDWWVQEARLIGAGDTELHQINQL